METNIEEKKKIMNEMVEAQARLLGIRAKELHSFRFDQLMEEAN